MGKTSVEQIDRKKALSADVIVTTSGMLNGGPALWYLNRLRHDTKNSIFFTGYQARDTGGRSLLEEGAIDIYGQRVHIDLEIQQFSFSTHAGHQEILDFAKACRANTWSFTTPTLPMHDHRSLKP